MGFWRVVGKSVGSGASALAKDFAEHARTYDSTQAQAQYDADLQREVAQKARAFLIQQINDAPLNSNPYYSGGGNGGNNYGNR